MPDEPIVPVPEALPEPAPPPEPVDEAGIPYKNRLAEYERKLAEANDREQRYMAALGQQRQQSPAVDPDADLESRFDDTTRKYVNRVVEKRATEIAENIGYKMMTQVNHTNILSANQELMEEARKSYQSLKANPLWSKVDDVLVQDRAITEARLNLATKQKAAQTAQQTQQATMDASRAQAAGATLPGTSGAPTQLASDKEKFIKEFMADPENRSWITKGDRIDPDSPEGQKLLRETAELNWKEPIRFTGATGAAYRAITNQFQVVNK